MANWTVGYWKNFTCELTLVLKKNIFRDQPLFACCWSRALQDLSDVIKRFKRLGQPKSVDVEAKPLHKNRKSCMTKVSFNLKSARQNNQVMLAWIKPQNSHDWSYSLTLKLFCSGQQDLHMHCTSPIFISLSTRRLQRRCTANETY